MPYTAPSLTQAIAALASRLNDSSNVHWTSAECAVYIREALRWWNGSTAHWRDRGTFTTTPAVAIYDLPTQISSLRGQTLTNWDLVTDLQYALQEPPAAGGTWTGTDQFTLAQLNTAIQRRRDQFLRETGAVLTSTTTAYASPAANGRLSLAEDVLIVRRAVWTTTALGYGLPLLVTDEWATTNYQPGWQQSTLPPTSYSVTDTPPITLQLIPPATGAGTLTLLSINAGAAVDPLVAAALGVPNDFAWVIKWGALADLLGGDGLALDPVRADYCEQRWRQGIDQAKAAPVVLTAQISDNTQSPAVDVPVRADGLSQADRYTPTWQLVPGIPNTVMTAGQTTIALSPPPGAAGGPWTVTLDVVRNAPVPAVGADILQISQDVYDSILDYAQHLALFKQGAGELQLSLALLDRASRAAGVDLSIQQGTQPGRRPLTAQTLRDEQAVARELPVAVG